MKESNLSTLVIILFKGKPKMIKLIFAIVIALFIFSLLVCVGIYKVSTNYDKYKKFFEQNKK